MRRRTILVVLAAALAVGLCTACLGARRQGARSGRGQDHHHLRCDAAAPDPVHGITADRRLLDRAVPSRPRSARSRRPARRVSSSTSSQQFSFGPYVSQIGRYPAEGTTGWVFKVNGVSPPVGADAVVLGGGGRGPVVLRPVRCRSRRAADARPRSHRGAAASVPTLSTMPEPAPSREAPSSSSTGARSSPASGRTCPRGVWREIRATKDGAIRSEVLRRAVADGRAGAPACVPARPPRPRRLWRYSLPARLGRLEPQRSGSPAIGEPSSC